jgi:transcriptional regulator with XRE-family HTH domain
MMEWGASRILALRKHAGMTQAQFAQWLGVTIKQVKYLEHQRRNPSGPSQRLLDILAHQLKYDGAAAIQVLGTGSGELSSPARVPEAKTIPAPRANKDKGAKGASETPHQEVVERVVESRPTSPDTEAFVWV